MVYIATAPTAPSANPLTSQAGSHKPNLEATFEAALEHARRLTTMFGIDNPETAIAWETVEELRSAKIRNTATPRVAFIRYCEENPDAFEARIYDC
ncbi:MAG: CP12 domain-containing protein [Cyanobacteria bacterium P01_A01_bin.135]